MSEWITHSEAAEILSCHVSLIPKMLRRGDLASRRERPSLLRADVEALRDRRAERPTGVSSETPVGSTTPQPPNNEHDWLLAQAAGEVMGVGPEAVKVRARRGKLPSELHDGRRWFRRDHLELVKRADEAKRAKVLGK